MRTKKLYKLLIFAKQAEKLETINTLQHVGALHVTKANAKETKMLSDESLPEVDEISHSLLKLQYIAKETGVDDQFYLEGLPRAQKVLSQSREFIEKHLVKVQDVVARKKELESSKAKALAKLTVLENIPFELSLKEASARNKFLLSSTKRIKNPKPLLISKVVFAGENAKKFYSFVEVSQKNLAGFHDALKKESIKLVDLSFLKESSSKAKSSLREEVHDCAQQLEEIKKRLFTLINGKQSKIKFLIASLLNYREQYNITRFFVKSKNFFALTGYCEGKDVNRIKDALPDASVYVRVAKDDAPTKLKNGPFSKNFELITNMFGTPNYGLVDPTILVTFFFPFFFGFMLSDIGYGLLLLLGVIGLSLHYGKSFKKGAIILGSSAVSSIIFGALFGSFFGNLIPVTPLFIDSFQGSFTILQIALAIGIIHINIALILNLYQLILKRSSVKDIVLQGLPNFVLQIAVIFAILGQYVTAAVLGVLLLVMLVLDKGPFGIMDITGFFGIWFSYARLLALSLATAGVALAINIVAQKSLAFGPIGFVLWLIVIVGGHLFNFALNILGCSIHSARLHYVEFFSFFFEGEGHPFAAFKVQKELAKSQEK